jgi:integrase
MSNIISLPLAKLPAVGKRKRSNVTLTDAHCEKRYAERVKIYDRRCPGLHVSVTTSGVATFYLKFSVGGGKQRSYQLGVYNPDGFRVADARAAAYSLRGNGQKIAIVVSQKQTEKEKQGITIDELIKLRVAWMCEPERKSDGEMRPRIESWKMVQRHLRRFLGARLGRKMATAVTKHDIAQLSNEIIAGKFGKPSISNARHMRRAATGLFNWAAEAGRDYVTESPCVNLPRLGTEHPKTRVLSKDEIKIFWHGLDREDLPWHRATRLALKFELVTMLRSRELLGAHRRELIDLDGEEPRFDVPSKRVKKRRVIQQPLSSLAVEIIKEALRSDDQQFVFASPFGDQPMHRKVMSTALAGTRYKSKVRTPGLCALLGLEPFTPHDLRRTAATLAGDLGIDDAVIAKCLDHQTSRSREEKVPTVTGKVYNHSKRMKQKRVALDLVAAELRRIIGEHAETDMRLAA